MTVSEELQQLIDNPATDDAARDTMQRALHAMKAMADQIGRQQEMAGKYARKVNQHNEAALTALIGLNHMLRMEAPENFQSAWSSLWVGSASRFSSASFTKSQKLCSPSFSPESALSTTRTVRGYRECFIASLTLSRALFSVTKTLGLM